MKGNSGQKRMPRIRFKVMTVIMSIRKLFRNTDDEVRYAGVKSGDLVLDFGCGPGFNTIPAARIVGSKGKVFALDIHEQALGIAQKKAEKYGLDNIETICSGCDTGLKSNSVDVVYLHNTLPMIKNKEDVLNEIYRVLKVRGRLSYMSRFFSRASSENAMSDEELWEYLAGGNKFRVVKCRKGHFIFEKMI